MYETADTALLGALPEFLDPGAEDSYDRAAGAIGGLLGMVVPIGAAFKAGKGVARTTKMAREYMGAGIPAAEVAAKMTTSPRMIAERLLRLRKLAASTQNPKLRAFYEAALLKAYQAAAPILKANRAIATATMPAAAAVGRFPNVAGTVAGVGTGAALYDMFDPQKYTWLETAEDSTDYSEYE
jgi:hypothetical protein